MNIRRASEILEKSFKTANEVILGLPKDLICFIIPEKCPPVMTETGCTDFSRFCKIDRSERTVFIPGLYLKIPFCKQK